MCGIIGVLNQTEPAGVDKSILLQMLAAVRHRGPDGFGIYQDEWVGLGSARLKILDIAGGDQPISNEDGAIWIVFNGEIFNYVELRPMLEARGHRFATHSDTEVIVHLFEDFGPACLQHLNGQFVIAIWDSRDRSLLLGRDRLGVRPLFYTFSEGRLIFGSEIKALLAHPGVQAQIDPLSLDQIFTYWSTLSPRTVFSGIFEVPPGSYLLARDGRIELQSYWSLDFSPSSAPGRDIQDYQDELESLLIDATRIRLRADVPVGAYLSGGLDSSITTAIIRNFTDTPLDTFSISFSDPEFDESEFQLRMADFLGTQHQVVHIHQRDIGEMFPQVIWHTETPILRTAPAPLFRLSRLAHEQNYKVVITGEGADEFLAGYDIFKEALIRQFWARQPASTIRPLLFGRLYPEIAHMPNSQAYLASFFGANLADTSAADYSHYIRWKNTSRTKRFFSDVLAERIASADRTSAGVIYPPDFADWDALGKAQYLESAIFLPQYLLSSQGDRVGMAHAVEGRFPFLDHRVVGFASHLPPHLRLNGLHEKYLLRRLARKWLPTEIWTRRKRPYRAPIHRCFFGPEGALDYVSELLSPACLQQAGLFKPAAVQSMVGKLAAGGRLGETDDMALAGILSAQLVWKQFVADFNRYLPPPLRSEDLTRAISRAGA
ncbi:MAG: asparagine synthase (glutamine-hydrolyzing) [Anaerolineae bacterium UTCFX2]|jgi:asparagine synthase (glutamine-hydrolysing)|nr:asparagine synthase (glutamine-hydrolyzing) [Anaerolineales bacterium]OQY93933.1 MAG: asparagine synthase (glutamine-hydrolyzing) [Anaerolineae bacterium UTCFX2]